MKFLGWLEILIQSIEKLYPKALADTPWDNVGLLLESPIKNPGQKRVLLTTDLTTAVAEEALAMCPPVGAIVTYHPVIFKAIKSLTLDNPQQKILLRLASAGISVYSPHTAMDAAVGGINDWLADGVSDEKCVERTAICPVKNKISDQDFGSMAGMGRLIRWEEPISIATVVERVKKHLCLSKIQLALSEKHRKEGSRQVYKIAICAGSGSSILKGVDADVLYTGELEHHDVLNATERGSSVILCGHSNTERGFLSCVMKKKLQDVLCEEFSAVKNDQMLVPEVVVSQVDKDPLEII